VVFSSSKNEQDLRRARDLGADLCLAKTCDPMELAQTIKMIQEFYRSEEAPVCPAVSKSAREVAWTQ
jgi:DNA-binding NarL/FixJ family response regulator